MLTAFTIAAAALTVPHQIKPPEYLFRSSLAAVVETTNSDSSGRTTANSTGHVSGVVNFDQDTDTVSYFNWTVLQAESIGVTTHTLIDGLGTTDFTLKVETEPWRWTMDGPVDSLLRQPVAGEFTTDGFDGSDVEDIRFAGSWELIGPVESVRGEFNFQPNWQGVENFFAEIAYDVQPIRTKPDRFTFLENDSRFLGLPTGPLWNGTLDGVDLAVSLDFLQVSGVTTHYIPEPASGSLLLIGLLVCSAAIRRN